MMGAFLTCPTVSAWADVVTITNGKVYEYELPEVMVNALADDVVAPAGGVNVFEPVMVSA